MDDLQDAKLHRRHQNRESQRRYRERNRKTSTGRFRATYEENEDTEGSLGNSAWQGLAGEGHSPHLQERQFHCENSAASARNATSWPTSSYQGRMNFGTDSNTKVNYGPLSLPFGLQPSMQSPQVGQSLPANLVFGTVPESPETLLSPPFNRMAFQMGMSDSYAISPEASVSDLSQSEAIQEGNCSQDRNSKSHMAVGLLAPHSDLSAKWQRPYNSSIVSRGRAPFMDNSGQIIPTQNSTKKEDHRVSSYHSPKTRRTGPLRKNEEGMKVVVWPKAKEMIDEISKLYEFGVKLELFEEDLALRDALVTVRKKFKAISKASEIKQGRSSQPKGHTSSSERASRHYESETDTSTDQYDFRIKNLYFQAYRVVFG